MHLVPVENTNMPSWVWDGFDWCDDLFFEAPDWRSDPDIQSVTRLPQGTTLRQLMTPKLWRQLNAIVVKKERSTFLKPWVLVLSIDALMFEQHDGVDPEFRKRLAKFPKPVAFLKQLESQHKHLKPCLTASI